MGMNLPRPEVGDEGATTTSAPREESTPTGEPLDSAAPLSNDVIFELLQVKRRRQVLRYLDDGDGTAEVGALAELIGAQENNKPERALSSNERKRVYIALYQCHLPKMDDAGVIDYTQARGTVELTDTADQLFPYLYLDPGDQTENNGPHPLSQLSRTVLQTFRS